jgi:hypothetical protein
MFLGIPTVANIFIRGILDGVAVWVYCWGLSCLGSLVKDSIGRESVVGPGTETSFEAA